MDQESAGNYYARVKVPFPDNRARNFNGMLSLSFKDELKREPGVGVYVGVAQDEASDDVRFPQDWKGTFPPNIMPNFSELDMFFDVVDITTGSNEGLSTQRIAQLIAMDTCTIYDWISIYASRVECFRKSMEARKEELSRLSSYSPQYLVHRANGSLRYVAVHDPVEARKILGEKQFWFRDYSLLVLKKMRTMVEIWTSEPDRVETKEMAAFLQQIEDSRISLSAIRPDKPVTYPWIVVDERQYCTKVNTPGGCKWEHGLCPYSHAFAGRECPSVAKKEPYALGNKYLKLHSVGVDQGRRSSNITTTFPGATSGFSPGHTPNTARGYCLKVNKPDGCDGTNCNLSHVLEGVPCRNGEHCTWGINCAYVHPERNATTPLIYKYTDLNPLLDEVLKTTRVSEFACI
jgi:hypothetical protein